eukprot:CAMPEP_0172725276 /NCGR_PEP_ID=MMETSP1074-20121228/88015_1 /TAXON_ID=2916 /ORGANISM="Ceratium fusus, Strain PA161109" /LENGTH=161 /DNA_ID=CAMNT_0013551999 /DNA_START=113 /DNA_END=598 /DNA_ORIENTATION=-
MSALMQITSVALPLRMSRERQEPPQAPVRKPSDVEVEVPPLELPASPRKRCASLDRASNTTREDASENASEEPFMLDDEDDFIEQNYQMELIGFDDDGPGGADFPPLQNRPLKRNGRARSYSCFHAPLSPGASPVLLSALERIAAEAGTHLGNPRGRADTL